MRYATLLLILAAACSCCAEPPITRVSLTAPKDGGTVDTATLNRVIRDLYDKLEAKAATSSIAAYNYTGEIRMFAKSAIPTGWLECAGTLVSRTTYATLFAAIGTTYGAGDGTTTFGLPDLRGRVPVGSGTGSGLTARTLGATGGAETDSHTLTEAEIPAHTHGSAGAHTHGLVLKDNFFTGYSGIADSNVCVTNDSTYETGGMQSAGTHTHTSVGGGGAHTHDIMQPFAVVVYAIYTGN